MAKNTKNGRRSSAARSRKTAKAEPTKAVTGRPSWRGMEALLAWSRRPKRLSRQDALALFAPAEPPPGVLPKGEPKMAMDDAMSSAVAWAGVAMSSAFAEGMMFMGYPFLAELATRAEYRQIVETVATDMTRKWIKLQSAGEEDNTDKLADIEAEMKRLDVQGAFKRLAEQDGFFGRAHLYLDTGDTEMRDELATSLALADGVPDPVKVNKNKPLVAVRPVEAVWTYPTRYNTNDPLSKDWYKPPAWFVMGKQIHASRLLTLVGREVPDLLKPAYSFGGLSMSQMAKAYVDNWLRTRQSVADIVHSFSVMLLKTDLMQELQGGDAHSLQERAEFFNNMRDNKGLMMIDKSGEDFANVSAPLGGLDLLQAQAQEHMAAVSRIPLVKLLGIQPAGLNASSEGEITVYGEGVHAYQESLFRAPLHLVLGYVQLSLYGKIDEDIGFEFEPLEELSEVEIAGLQKMKAETHTINIDNGAISPEEVRASIAADPASPYADLDPDDMPEPPEPDIDISGGAPPFGGGGKPFGGGEPAKAASEQPDPAKMKEAA